MSSRMTFEVHNGYISFSDYLIGISARVFTVVSQFLVAITPRTYQQC